MLKNGVEVDGMSGDFGPTDTDDFECQRQPRRRGRPKTWFAIVAIEFAARCLRTARDNAKEHEAWVNTLSWPTRAVVCRKDDS